MCPYEVGNLDEDRSTFVDLLSTSSEGESHTLMRSVIKSYESGCNYLKYLPIITCA